MWKLCRFKVCLFAFCILHSCSPHILLSVSVVRLKAVYVRLTKRKWEKKLLTSLSQNIGKWNICVLITWCSCWFYMYNKNILSYQLDSEYMRTVFLGLFIFWHLNSCKLRLMFVFCFSYRDWVSVCLCTELLIPLWSEKVKEWHHLDIKMVTLWHHRQKLILLKWLKRQNVKHLFCGDSQSKLWIILYENYS